MTRPRAQIVVELPAIRHNVEVLREHTGVAVMTVVKADGYGHGMVPAARAAREGGAAWLGVATIDEALELRAAGDTGRVLCWLTVPGEDYAPAIEADVDVSVYTEAELAEVVAAVRDVPARVQIKVDTGLSRGGAAREHWDDLFGVAADHEREGSIRATGIWSHFACSDEPDHPANDAQQAAFEDALELAKSAGLEPEVRHLANSAAAILRPSARYDLVRCGLASYGLDPAPGHTPDLGDRDRPGLLPAMHVSARLALVKRIDAGAGVSYGHTWHAERPVTVGLVPVGYGDGVPRHAGNRAEVQVGARRRPVRGRVCMDQFVVELAGERDDPGATEGDDVVLFSSGLYGEPTAQDWAEWCDTISYEIVTRIGGRFERRYIDEVTAGE
ncbi:MAG: alanine racemase [Nocardioides sp.]